MKLAHNYEDLKQLRGSSGSSKRLSGKNIYCLHKCKALMSSFYKKIIKIITGVLGTSHQDDQWSLSEKWIRQGPHTLNLCVPHWLGCHLEWRSGTEMYSAPLQVHNRHNDEDRPCSQGWSPGRLQWRRSTSIWLLCLPSSSWKDTTPESFMQFKQSPRNTLGNAWNNWGYFL